jgi:hypothetical protein
VTIEDEAVRCDFRRILGPLVKRLKLPPIVHRDRRVTLVRARIPIGTFAWGMQLVGTRGERGYVTPWSPCQAGPGMDQVKCLADDRGLRS